MRGPWVRLAVGLAVWLALGVIVAVWAVRTVNASHEPAPQPPACQSTGWHGGWIYADCKPDGGRGR